MLGVAMDGLGIVDDIGLARQFHLEEEVPRKSMIWG